MEERTGILKRASIIALVGNLLLAAAKLTIGFIANSLSVISDGIDSSIDVISAIVTITAARIIEKPGDREHPYGHARAETMATTVLSFIVFFAGAQLLLKAIEGFASGEIPPIPDKSAIIVTVISIIGKLFLARSQYVLGKKADSAMLIANGKNMSGDVITSASVLVGLAATLIFKVSIIDRIMTILVSLWIIKNAIGIFLGANSELMEGIGDKDLYNKVFEAVASVPGAGNPHRARIRRLGSWLVVDLDIEVKATMTVAASHRIAEAVEAAIMHHLPGVYDVMIHIEPAGDVDPTERYGLRPED